MSGWRDIRRVGATEEIKLSSLIKDIVIRKHGVEMGDVIVTKGGVARLKVTRSRRAKRCNMGAETDGGIDVKINGMVIGCED